MHNVERPDFKLLPMWVGGWGAVTFTAGKFFQPITNFFLFLLHYSIAASKAFLLMWDFFYRLESSHDNKLSRAFQRQPFIQS